MAIELHEVKLPEKGTITTFSGDADENMFLFKLETFTVPGDFYRLDLANYDQDHFFKNKEYKQVTGYDYRNFAVDHITYKSKDGTSVPMTLIRKKKVLKSLKDKPTKPILTHLYGYGGFGDTCKPTHAIANEVFMNNMDGMYVVAHIRGGGEYGDDWWEQGKKEKKQNSFDDFIAAAEYLIEKGYTDSKHLLISGRSNGGQLVAAVTNQRPDLFALVQVNVPVTDMLRYHHFSAGVNWMDEYGYVDEDGAIDYLLKYSPLHTVKQTRYPWMWVVTGDHDDRVVPSHSFKYVAELQWTAGKVPD